MVQPSYIAALLELRKLPPPEDQLTLLRLLKNDIVGHGQRKEHVVRQGLLEPLTHILSSTAKSTGKKASKNHLLTSRPSLEDDIRLQATLILGSLANAGPAFVPPILASGLPQALLQALDPSETLPKLLVATLRTLNNIASAWALLVFASPKGEDLSFADSVLKKPTIDAFIAILQQTSTSLAVQQQIALTATLISECCVSDAARNLLVKEGLLDALANLLASFALSNAGPSHHAGSSFDVRPSGHHIMNAVAAIIEGSNYRTHRLIYSPILSKVLSPTKEPSFFDETQGPNFSQHRRPSDVVSVENLLPKIMIQKSVSFGSHSFPALALANSRLMAEQSIIDSPSSSPLCVWLIHLSRVQTAPSHRLAALRLLALVSNALDADTGDLRPEIVPRSRERERQIALLAVPIAVKLVKDLAIPPYNLRNCSILKTEACAVLARLIRSNVELQKAAHSAESHKYIAQILKRSFNAVTLARPMWSPQSQLSEQQTLASPTTTLGDGGLPQEVVHALKCRAGALEAVAAIAEREDSIRKDLIEAGVAPYIIESLTPFPDAPASGASAYQPKDGNTVPVILAACQAATAMSRSVGNLRTSLIDAGLGKPVFALLQHSDKAVQIAATDVSINLVLDFSPMREDLIQAGVIQIFCMHAKRSSPKLRQVSLWGLKHLVLNAPQTVKHACLEELGSGWLIQTINGEHLDTHSNHPLGMSTSNAQGQKVDILNSPDSAEMDVDPAEDDDSDDDDEEVTYDQNGTRYQSSSLRSTLESTSQKARLRIFREQEFNISLQAQQDDILIQEQALDFIRNLINGDDNVQMIDHLNNTIGANRIFDMLYNKLMPAGPPAAPVPGFSFAQRQSPIQSRNLPILHPLQQPPELVRAALGVLIHLAAGSSKHRQQLVAQKQLLTAWLAYFNHPDRQIRVSSVWAVINLTWPETAGDRDDAKRRAMELRNIGIEAKVRSLANDPDLDTRERVKTATRQIDELLGVGRR